DYPRFLEANRRFHFTIYEAAGSRYLINMIAGLWDLAERYRYRYMFLKDRADVIQGEHRAILAACQAHDAAALRQAISAHMNHTLEGVRAYLIAEQDLPESEAD
ncbi:MAG: FCD domain-containing protein, partial [Chloroflexi bacterium]|nr:FCD domain-containing protein [Chloroflexota bacterium]